MAYEMVKLAEPAKESRAFKLTDVAIESDTSDTSVTSSDTVTKDKCSVEYIYETYLCYDRNKLNKFYVLLVNLVMPSISISIPCILAYTLNEPFIFPSLGPTAFLHFAIPDHPPSSPRNTILGHLLSIIMGYIALLIMGLENNASTWIEGIIWERILCVSIAIGSTCALMILFEINHPPSAATTLIVALGILTSYKQFGIIMLSVLIMTVTSFILNRIIRTDAIYPLWMKHCKCAFCSNKYGVCMKEMFKYDRHDMKFVHVIIINLFCPFIALLIVGVIGYYTNLPFLFPSLGPTTFIQFAIFSEAPSSPRNTFMGHAIGIIFGYLALLIFGLTSNPSVGMEGMSQYRIGCVTFALGMTCFLMILFQCQHPPAAATTLIVSMGILRSYTELGTMMAAVVILTIFAFVMNRILRADGVYPIWSKTVVEEQPLTRQDTMRGVLEPVMGYHRFPTIRNIKFVN